MIFLLLACASEPITCVDVVYVDVEGTFSEGTYSEVPCVRDAEYPLLNYSDCCPEDFYPQGWSGDQLVCIWYGE